MLPVRTGYQAPPPLPQAGEEISIYPPPLTGEGMVGTVGESRRGHLIASPFGTIHLATFRFPQPVGTGIPSSPGLRRAAYTASSDATGALAGSLPAPPSYPHSIPPSQAAEGGVEAWENSEGSDREFPEINRSLKGPRLVPRVRPDFDSPQPSTVDGLTLSSGLASVAPPAPVSGASEEPAPDRAPEPGNANPAPADVDFTYLDAETAEPWLVDGEDAPIHTARIYFGTASLGGTPATIEPWAPGQSPIFEPPEPEATTPNVATRLEPSRNETIAPKGVVTGEEHRPMSPAERLGLIGGARARHERCLADAIYFEARGESVRGQMAVAQVVINRVFSGYYPNNVCGVVYQNAHRRFRCQFTFACDGLPERISEPIAWERAKHIARDALDGDFWLNDVGKATHYHARWVHPWWVHEMRRLDRIGVHTFYRPRNWGDGSKSPIWGDAEGTAAAAKTL
jgi:spore germination cell wall hydrolase CwlJ-like protein